MKIEYKYLKDKKCRKFRDHCLYAGEYRDAAESKCNLKYSAPNKIYIDFNDESTCDYHYIIKELAEEI